MPRPPPLEWTNVGAASAILLPMNRASPWFPCLETWAPVRASGGLSIGTTNGGQLCEAARDSGVRGG